MILSKKPISFSKIVTQNMILSCVLIDQRNPFDWDALSTHWRIVLFEGPLHGKDHTEASPVSPRSRFEATLA